MEVNQKLEYWKNRLLDLGKRNRLINCALPKQGKSVSRATLLIYNPLYDDLWDMFSNGETALEFPIPADPIDNEAQESLFESDTFQNGIKTNQSPAETCKTLRSLMKKSKEFTEEKGLNALHIAFGFLNWKEKGTEGQDMRSPLLLVPVILTQESLNDPIMLSRSDDEITINHALEQKLLNDFGIELPEFEEDNDWNSYLKHVQEACEALKWSVESDVAQLSLFSFLKINMYRDLEKNADKIGGHHIVRALNGEVVNDGVDCSDIICFNHDMIEPQKVFSVVDADSSQQDAILLAKRGASFVLQGPPGTGKSQTITNIIAELIADGRKVLFVSEKMAALEVVYKRLKQAGLSDFCLTLHSHKAKRREILDQLGVSLKLSREKVELQQEAFGKLYQLKETRAALNLYAQEVYTKVEPLGQSIYDVNGFMAKYENYKNIDYIQTNAENFTPELLSQSESALEELARIVNMSDYQQNNPWNGCVLTVVTHEFRQQFLVDTGKLQALILDGIALYDQIISMFGSAKLIPSYITSSDVIALFDLAKQSPNIPAEWLQLNLTEHIGQASNCVELLRQRNNLDKLHSSAIQYEKKLQEAIQSAVGTTVGSISEAYSDESNDTYSIACSDFFSVFNADVAKTISDKSVCFLEQFKLCKNMNNKYVIAQEENKNIEKFIATISFEENVQSASSIDGLCNKFLSVFDSDTAQSIAEKSDTYHEQFLLCRNLNGKYVFAQKENEEIEKIVESTSFEEDNQFIPSFYDLCNRFLSAFDSDTEQSIAKKSDTYHEQFLLCRNLNGKYLFAQKENVKLNEVMRVVTQSLELEQQSLSKMQAERDSAIGQISADFDAKILSVDIENMLSRYRTSYRSSLRFFNSQYRSDRKELLAYCKTDTKMSYSNALLLLDKVYNAQCAQENFEKQAKTVNATLASKNGIEMEISEKITATENLAKALSYNNEKLQLDKKQLLSECTNAIKKLEDSLSASKIKLESDKQRLLSECAVAINKLGDSLSANKESLELVKQQLVTRISDVVKDLGSELSYASKKFDDMCQSLGSVLGVEVSGIFDFAVLKEKLYWALRFQAETRKYALGSSFTSKVCECDSEIFCKITKYTSDVNGWACEIQPWLRKFAKLFEERWQPQFNTISLAELKQTVQTCQSNFASLEYLIDYRNAERRLTELGIDAFLEKARVLNLAAEEIVPIFKKCFYRSWLDAIMPKFPSVNSFRGMRQNEYIKQFRQLDKQHLEISKATLLSTLISRLPNLDSFSANSGEVALLRREMAKQRKLMPTRKLIASVPNLLPALKPCIMMSPLSVSTYLGNSSYEFDTVIFDEASQVPTEDAICSIFRAKQAIIAGDSKQLPPTDFFSSSISDSGEFEEDEKGDVNDTGAYESLLEEASMLPPQTLLWHYRSKHENLIAFSNAKIYQGNLITFPSSVEKADGMGVEYIRVTGGMYERGGKKGNQKEAEKIAELVFEHFRKYPHRTLGIIAFGEVQQTAIEEAMIRKRQENPQYETFFKEGKEEAVFIKNLETVQGDERDTIIFSIGYAPDASGKFIMNFGPLSRNGGERRLNVAITRARYNLKLVGSIMPTDIDADRTSGQGPKLLRLYIDFAINGAKAILGETTINSNVWFDSPFEEAVYNFIAAKGYDVVTQVGCSGYRIDMAVRHPKYNGRFAIGIECDGKAYHSARTARERDRLRQTVLEDMGWNIYRVWSTDWIKDQHTEGERLLTAIKQAIENYSEQAPKTYAESTNANNFLDVRAKSIQESFSEKYQSLRSKYAGYNANEIPVSDFEQTMLRVLVNSYGLDKNALFKEMAQYGYNWQRQGSSIKEKFELAYRNLITHEVIIEDDAKIKLLLENPFNNSN